MIATWFSVLLLTGITLTAQISGRVISSSGMPVQGATVITPLLFQATTAESGEYVLDPRNRPGWKPKIVIFYAPGFRPLVKTLSEEDSVVDAILTPEEGPGRRVDACSAAQKGERRVGDPMSFALPPEVRVHSSNGGDYILHSLFYRSGGQPSILEIWEGMSCCNGRPLKDESVIAAALTMRTWGFEGRSQKLGGLDMRGTSTDGTFWRWMGPLSGSQINYQNATEAVARVFDAIIDSMCVGGPLVGYR